MKFHISADMCFDVPNRPDEAVKMFKELKDMDPMDIVRGKADIITHTDYSFGFGCFEE